MTNTPGPQRREALYKISKFCHLRSGQAQKEEEMAEELGFGSVEAMYTQMKNWELPNWIVYGEPLPKPGGDARQPEGQKLGEGVWESEGRKPRGDSAPQGDEREKGEELPPASDAADLFKEALDALYKSVERLKHRRETLEGGRFVVTSVDTDPVYHLRSSYSDEDWREVCELYDLDPDAEGFRDSDMRFVSPAGASWIPPAPLPALVAVYLLLGRPLNPLLKKLHPRPDSADREKIVKLVGDVKRTEENQSAGNTGLIRTAGKIAALVRGGDRKRGAPPPDLLPVDHAAAQRITELREAGTSEEEINEEMSRLGLKRKDVSRLRSLQERRPEA